MLCLFVLSLARLLTCLLTCLLVCTAAGPASHGGVCSVRGGGEGGHAGRGGGEV